MPIPIPAAIASRARRIIEPRQQLLANTSWLLGDKLARIAVGFIVNAWVVRYLGPDGFGRLSYALAFVALFTPFATLGVEPILVRELVSAPERRGDILGTAWFLRVAGSLAGLAALIAILSGLGTDPEAFTLIAILGVALCLQSFEVIETWFQARLQMRFAVIARTASLAVASCARIGFILARWPLVAFAWAAAIESTVAAVALAIAYGRAGAALREWRFDRGRAAQLVRDGWPFLFSNAMIMIYMRIDQIMIGRMIGVGELGIYSVAVKLTEVWYMIPMVISSSVFPGIVRARAEGEAPFHAKLQRFYDRMALLGYGVALPVTLLAPWIVRLAFGDAYARAAAPLQVLVWTVLFTSLGVARSSFLTAMNWARIHLITVTAGAVANVVLNLVLIPRYGVLGAAIATLVAQWLAAHGTCFLVPALRPTGRMLTRALLLGRAG